MDVRLHSIDMPERTQPWGPQATAALARRLKKGTEVSLEPITQDKYDRLVAVVYQNDENINAWMVQQGNAWAYRQYMNDARYCRWEQQTRAQGLGVRSLPSTQRIAPWEYRHAERAHREIVTGETVETESGCISAMHRGSSETAKHVPSVSPVPDALGGQTEPSDKCRIKGNIGESGRIYHVPGSRSYDKTRISPSRGERWFCSEEEAREAGWREGWQKWD